MKQPKTLNELWAWLLDEADLGQRTPPLALHVSIGKSKKGLRVSYPKDTAPARWRERGRPAAIAGLPYSADFWRYLSGAPIPTPARRALWSMHSRRGPQTDGYIICWAVLENGYTTQEAVRELLRCDWHYFKEAALPALTLLWEKAEQIANADLPVDTDRQSVIVPVAS